MVSESIISVNGDYRFRMVLRLCLVPIFVLIGFMLGGNYYYYFLAFSAVYVFSTRWFLFFLPNVAKVDRQGVKIALLPKVLWSDVDSFYPEAEISESRLVDHELRLIIVPRKTYKLAKIKKLLLWHIFKCVSLMGEVKIIFSIKNHTINFVDIYETVINCPGFESDNWELFFEKDFFNVNKFLDIKIIGCEQYSAGVRFPFSRKYIPWEDFKKIYPEKGKNRFKEKQSGLFFDEFVVFEFSESVDFLLFNSMPSLFVELRDNFIFTNKKTLKVPLHNVRKNFDELKSSIPEEFHSHPNWRLRNKFSSGNFMPASYNTKKTHWDVQREWNRLETWRKVRQK